MDYFNEYIKLVEENTKNRVEKENYKEILKIIHDNPNTPDFIKESIEIFAKIGKE